MLGPQSPQGLDIRKQNRARNNDNAGAWSGISPTLCRDKMYLLEGHMPSSDVTHSLTWLG